MEFKSKIIWIEDGLKIIEINKIRLYECKCFESDCEEGFYITTSTSCPPYCPSCGKDNTNYVSDNDINTITIASI